MKFINFEQGSDEWLESRKGIPTASMFSAVLAKGRNGTASKTRKTYMYKLAGEIISSELAENFTTPAMERGHEMEILARIKYEFDTFSEVEQVGLCVNDGAGASSDGLVGVDGCIEIKSKAPHILIDVLLKKEMPPEHKPQVQGQLMVLEREWCDFVAYYTGMPMFVKRIYRDEDYIDNLKGELTSFKAELSSLVNQVRSNK